LIGLEISLFRLFFIVRGESILGCFDCMKFEGHFLRRSNSVVG